MSDAAREVAAHLLRPVVASIAERAAQRVAGIADPAECERVLREEVTSALDGFSLDLATWDALDTLDRLNED